MGESKQRLLTQGTFHPANRIIPKELFLLGNALGKNGPVCMGANNTPAARMLLRGAAAGVAAAGSRVTVHSLPSPIQGSWALRKNQAARGLFLEAKGWDHLRLWVMDERGLLLEEQELQHLEQEIQTEALYKVQGAEVGTLAGTPLTQEQWAAEITKEASLPHPMLRRLTVAVEGPSPANQALVQTLRSLGCQVEGAWRPGIPGFSARWGGFALQARDERGVLLSPDQLLALEVLLEMEHGQARVTVPSNATAAVDLVAAGYNGRVERLNGKRNDPALERYAAQPWLWAAPSAAVRICARMRTSGQRLDTLMGKTPCFSRHSRDISFPTGQAQAAILLAGDHFTPLAGGGARLRKSSGWVSLVPRSTTLQVTAEGPDLELAAELCDWYAHRATALSQVLEGNSHGKK